MNTKMHIFIYRDNLFQATMRFIFYLILVAGGIFAWKNYDIAGMSAEEVDYYKNVSLSFSYFGILFSIFSLVFFYKVIVLKNTKLIIESGKLYMPPFGFSKKGRELIINSILDLRLEGANENKKILFRYRDSSISFQLDSSKFVNNDFEIFYDMLKREKLLLDEN